MAAPVPSALVTSTSTSAISHLCLALLLLLLCSPVPQAWASRPVLPLMPHPIRGSKSEPALGLQQPSDALPKNPISINRVLAQEDALPLLSKDPLSDNSKDPISDEPKDPLSDKRMLLALMKGDTHLEAPAPSPDSLSPFLEDPMAPSPDAGDKMFKRHHPRHPKHPRHHKHPPPSKTSPASSSSSDPSPSSESSPSAASSPSSDPSPPSDPSLSLNPDEITQLHNTYRTEAGITPPLQWSDKYAGTAQHWAEQLANSCDPNNPQQDAIQHTPDSSTASYGENLAGPVPKPNPIAASVREWYTREKDSYHSESCGGDPLSKYCCTGNDFEKCGHYAIMIDPGNSVVGCGGASCGVRGTIVVCHYY